MAAPDDVWHTPAPHDAVAHLHTAAQQHQRQALRALDPDAALRAAAAARKAALALPDGAAVRTALVDLGLLEAQAHLMRGDANAAARALHVAVRLDARDALHPGHHAPALRDAWVRARAHRPAGRGVLALEARTPDTTFSLDGAQALPGAHPVGAGLHLVTARAPGRRAVHTLYDVAAGQTVHVAPLPLPAQAMQIRVRALATLRTSPPAASEARDAALAALSALSGASVVWLGDAPRAWLDGRAVPLSGADVASGDALCTALRAARAPAGADPGIPGWAWAAGTTGLVAAAAGAAWATWAALQPPPARTGTVTCCGGGTP